MLFNDIQKQQFSKSGKNDQIRKCEALANLGIFTTFRKSRIRSGANHAWKAETTKIQMASLCKVFVHFLTKQVLKKRQGQKLQTAAIFWTCCRKCKIAVKIVKIWANHYLLRWETPCPSRPRFCHYGNKLILLPKDAIWILGDGIFWQQK